MSSKEIRTSKGAEPQLVSFIIVNYNGKHYLKKCFDSILKQEYPKEKIEIIMVDNGSSDDSISFVKKEYPSVKIIQNQENNYCKANNIGIRNAEGAYIALVNNDVVLDKKWLISLFKEIIKEENIAGVGGKIYLLDGLIQSAGQVRTQDWMWKDIGIKEEDKGQYNEKKEVIALSGCVVLYKKESLSLIGGFDEDLIMYYDEADLGFRLKEKNLKLVYVPKAVAHHKLWGTVTEKTLCYYLARNRLMIIAKHNPQMLLSILPESDLFIKYDEGVLKKELLLIFTKAGFDDEVSTVFVDLLINAKRHVSADVKTRITTEKDKEIEQRDNLIKFKDDLLVKESETSKHQDKIMKQREEVLKEKDKEIDKLHIEREELERKKDEKIQRIHKEKEEQIKQKDKKIQEITQQTQKTQEEIKQQHKEKQEILKQLQKTQEEKEEQIKQKDTEIQRQKTLNQQKKEEILKIREELDNLKKDLELTSQELTWRKETLDSIYNSRLYKYLGKHVWDLHNKLIKKKKTE